MQKRLIMTAVGASAVIGYMLRNKETRDKVKHAINSVMSYVGRDQEPIVSTIEQAGIPDQLELTNTPDDTQLENSKMVAEGSSYGVHYYNEAVQEQEIMQ